MLSNEHKKSILALARASIGTKFNGPKPVVPNQLVFHERKGIFVTLHMKGELRGCIGYIQGYKALGASIVELAQAAAYRDPRFAPVKSDELSLLEIEISILSDLVPVTDTSEIVIGRDGLYIDHHFGSGLLLPQVAVEWNWDVPEFVAQVCRKAGLPKNAWLDPESKLFRFEAEVFSEKDTSQ